MLDSERMSSEIIGQSKESTQIVLNRSINSTVLFVVSFILVFFIQNLTFTLFASLFDFNPVLYFNNVILTNKQVQNTNSILLVNASAIVADLIIGFLCFRISFSLRSRPGLLKLLFQWMGLHGYLFFLCQIAFVIFFPNQYFGIITSMLGGDIYFRFVTMALASVGIVMLGMISARSFLQLSNTSFYIRQGERRREFIQQIALIPWLIGLIAATLFFLPETNLFTSAVLLANGLVLVISYFTASSSANGSIKLFRLPPVKKVKLEYIAALVILYIITHFLLSPGVKL